MKDRLAPYISACLLCVVLFRYAVTGAFVWDEGFHLLAAQFIQAGKRPYLDFCFPQTPLNAYWNAWWMSMFGDSWRVTHVIAAALVMLTMVLVIEWSLHEFRDSRWRSSAAMFGVLLLGTNLTVFQFAPIGQAYALCMFCGWASFVVLNRMTSAWAVLLAGLLAGTGAGASLLIAPLPLVFAIWLLRTRGVRPCAAFVAGCVIPFLPVAWLLVQGPHQTWFNVVQYQALFRRVNWGNANEHDVDVLSSWVDESFSLLLVLLFVAGVRRRGLVLWASLGLILYISTAHPTFARYYIVGAPFYVGVATAGYLWACARLFPNADLRWHTAALGLILVIGEARFIYNQRDATTWAQYEKVAAKVASVTPKGGVVFADELVYFLLHWVPPTGLNFSYAEKLDLPAREEAALHIVSEKKLQQQTAAHRFAVFQTCKDEVIDKWQLDNIYKHRQDFDDCAVFWELR